MKTPAAPMIATGVRPRVAILREQGVNGQIEMAAAFDRAGFECGRRAHERSHRGALRARRILRARRLRRLLLWRRAGAGEGWAKSILFNPRARDAFSAFFDAQGHLRPGRVQRLSDDVRAARADSGRRRTGRSSSATVPSSSRRASRWSKCCRSPSILFARHGRFAHADRGGARRRKGRIRRRGTAPDSALVALRYRRQLRPRDRTLSVQPERLAAGHHRLTTETGASPS